MEHVNDWCFIYKGGIWEDDLNFQRVAGHDCRSVWRLVSALGRFRPCILAKRLYFGVADPVADWLMTLSFSAVKRSSSHRSGLESK